MSGTPRVSVVIPVGRPVPALVEQLTALAGSRALGPAELVLAANHAVDPVRAACDLVDWPVGWTTRVVDATHRRGPSYARNVGWRSATGSVVLFCDADDRVQPDWAAVMARAVEEHGIAGGRLAYDLLNSPALERRVTASTDALPVKFHHLPYTPSCNLGMSRALLEATGGFDESLRCGEDIDLCWRARERGVELVFVPEAVVQYRLRASPRDTFLQAVRYSSDDAALLRRHRAAGARWGIDDTVREAAALVKALALVCGGSERRITAAARTGAFCGRLHGSVRHRVFTL